MKSVSRPRFSVAVLITNMLIFYKFFNKTLNFQLCNRDKRMEPNNRSVFIYSCSIYMLVFLLKRRSRVAVSVIMAVSLVVCIR